MSISLLQKAESIEFYKEDHAFLQSYDLAPPPPPPLPLRQMSFFLSRPVCRRSRLLTGEGEGRVVEPNNTTSRKTWSSIKSFNTPWW
jgi:hypothetical protein